MENDEEKSLRPFLLITFFCEKKVEFFFISKTVARAQRARSTLLFRRILRRSFVYRPSDFVWWWSFGGVACLLVRVRTLSLR